MPVKCFVWSICAVQSSSRESVSYRNLISRPVMNFNVILLSAHHHSLQVILVALRPVAF